MGFFETASILLTLAALFSYVNCRYIRLPTTIGVMLLSLGSSLLIMLLGSIEQPFRAHLAAMVSGIDFNQTLLHGMLAFLLFAGSLQLDLNDLGKEWDAIGVLSLAGTAISTLLVGGASWLIFRQLNLGVPLIWCMLFGALISPTDPIAVLAIMRKVGAPKPLETQMTGESLFNDGIGVVIFLTLLDVVVAQQAPSWGGMLLMLSKEVIGGIVVGLASGILIYRLLLSVDNYQVEILLTLALAMGGYTLAEALHVSAPIAVVVAGLFIGNRGRTFAMSRTTEEHLDMFWELLDEVLNVVLFLLIGLEVLVMPYHRQFVLASVAAVAIVLLARLASVAGCVTVMRTWRRFEQGAVTVLTWGGLRGGLSVAMALSLPTKYYYHELIVVVTYSVVVFSVFVQGLSSSRVIRAVTRTSK
jgi:CPA1 family monovalent cation:H+ antiporter